MLPSGGIAKFDEMVGHHGAESPMLHNNYYYAAYLERKHFLSVLMLCTLCIPRSNTPPSVLVGGSQEQVGKACAPQALLWLCH